MTGSSDAPAATARPRVAANCTGCGACVPVCPVRAISLESEFPAGRGRKTAVIATARCTGCRLCVPACPRGALLLTAISPRTELFK